MPLPRRRPEYSNEAKLDIEDIYLYSRQQWGVPHAKSYSRMIRQSVQALAQHPMLGHARDELYPGLRSRPVGSHVIYYSIQNDTVKVARILHERRDVARIHWLAADNVE